MVSRRSESDSSLPSHLPRLCLNGTNSPPPLPRSRRLFIYLPLPPLSLSQIFFSLTMDSSNTKITIRTKKPTHPVGNNSTPPAFMTSSRKSTSSPTPFSTKDATPTVFLPASPTPHVFDPAKRLQELKDGLDPKSSFYYFYEGQHPNIRAAIKAYEEGKIPLGSTRYFLGGKIVPEAEATRANTFVWKEVYSLFYFPSFLTCSFTSLTVPKPQHAGYRHAQW